MEGDRNMDCRKDTHTKKTGGRLRVVVVGRTNANNGWRDSQPHSRHTTLTFDWFFLLSREACYLFFNQYVLSMHPLGVADLFVLLSVDHKNRAVL